MCGAGLPVGFLRCRSCATFYLLGFGVTVPLGVPPTQPGQGFWRPEKFFYGFLPRLATPAILAITLRRWVRLFARERNAWLTLCAVAVFAVSLHTIVFLKLRGRQDERIHLDWQKESAIFSWGTGQVKMPAGFTYARETGIDTFVGRFTSQDGRLVIEQRHRGAGSRTRRDGEHGNADRRFAGEVWQRGLS